mmetsp:Transcript_108066/g.220647  ORF Transcript_108066/g.220647 Transcript_108066/m.220647 type:complete len:396 (+) Transcript_108066:118-1305(+)
MFSGSAQQLLKAGSAQKLPSVNGTGGKDRQWLFCIPIQVGPATPYARNVTHWMHAILVVQLFVCTLRFVVLLDFSGGLWMALVIALGWYALWNEMNITYICTWGIACFLNGLFDVLGLILPFVFGIMKFQLLSTILRVCIPCCYLLGALFAWHLYHDYARSKGLHTITDYDPIGKYVDSYDPEENLPLSAQNLGKGFGQRLGFGQQQAAVGAAAGAGVAAAATAGGAAAASSGGWLKGFLGGSSPQGQRRDLDSMAPQMQEQMQGYAQRGQEQFQRGQQQAQGLFSSGQAQAQGLFSSFQDQVQERGASAQRDLDDVSQAPAAAFAQGIFAQGQQKADVAAQYAAAQAAQFQGSQNQLNAGFQSGKQRARNIFSGMQDDAYTQAEAWRAPGRPSS